MKVITLMLIAFLSGCASYNAGMTRANEALGQAFDAITNVQATAVAAPLPAPTYPRSTLIIDGRVVNCYDLGNNTVTCL